MLYIFIYIHTSILFFLGFCVPDAYIFFIIPGSELFWHCEITSIKLTPALYVTDCHYTVYTGGSLSLNVNVTCFTCA